MSDRWIDTHRHVWDRRRHDHPWMGSRHDLPRSTCPESDPQIVGRVLVEAGAAPHDVVAETAWLVDLARTSTTPTRVVAAQPPATGTHQTLDGWAAQPEVAGVRITMSPATQADHLTTDIDQVLGRRLAVEVLVGSAALSRVAEALEGSTAPGVVVVDHLGGPQLPAPPPSRWLADLDALAQDPRVVVKLSGMAALADRLGSLAEQCAPYVQEVARRFGPDRLVLGSDWPVSAGHPDVRTPSDWPAVVRAALGDRWSGELLVATPTRVYGF